MEQMFLWHEICDDFFHKYKKKKDVIIIKEELEACLL